MSLHGLRKPKEPGLQRPLDVRGLGLDIKRENEFSAAEWESWIKVYTECARQRNWLECLNIAYQLKIIAPERVHDIVKLEHQAKMLKDLRQRFSGSLGIYPHVIYIAEYCYLFSQEPETMLADNRLSLDTSKQQLIQELAEEFNELCFLGRDFDDFLATCAWSKNLFPDLLTQNFLDNFWHDLHKSYETKSKFSRTPNIELLAYLHILYPNHLEELTLGDEQCIDLSPQDSYKKYAFKKILANPNMLEPANWPPKSTEPRITNSVPEQPENLNL